MRLVIQRVTQASVRISGGAPRAIEKGLVIFVGVTGGDTAADAEYLADKCTGLRIFSDDADKMNLSVADIGGALLIISQFTLYGDCKKGKRPNFMRAARPEEAIPVYERFLQRCRATGLPVETGEFGAEMQVALTNDGPVTIVMDTAEMRPK